MFITDEMSVPEAEEEAEDEISSGISGVPLNLNVLLTYFHKILFLFLSGGASDQEFVARGKAEETFRFVWKLPFERRPSESISPIGSRP